MNIFSIADPSLFPAPILKPRFRSILVTGTWLSRRCSRDGQFHSELIPPLRIEWDTRGTEIGDIAFNAGSQLFVCATAAAHRLDTIGDQFKYEKVVVDPGRLKVGGKLYNEILRKKFVWPVPKKMVPIDPVENSLVEEVLCEYCQARRYKFKRDNLLFDEARVAVVDAFTIPEVGKYYPVFVTEAYMRKLRKCGFENITFREAGTASRGR